mgnify:CR=1 FL=1
MIVDCHTHIWEATSQLGLEAAEPLVRTHRGPAGHNCRGWPDASHAEPFSGQRACGSGFVLGSRAGTWGRRSPRG